MTVLNEQPLEAQLNLIKFPNNTKLTYELGVEVPWVKTLLMEMNETATDKTPEQWLEETELFIKIELTKKFTNEMGEYLLASGHFQVTFATESVRSLKPLLEEQDMDFKAVFLSEEQLKSEMYAEIDETWVDGDTYELYSYKKGVADIAEMLHERLFLSRDLYPLAEGENPDDLLDGTLETDKPRQ